MIDDAQHTQHSKLSPSSSSRWVKCPYSLSLQDLYPTEDESNPASIRGTIIHWVGEELLSFDRHFQVHKQYTCSQGNDFVLSEEMLTEGEYYRDYCLDVFDNNTHSTMRVEKKIDLTMLHQDTFGTMDCSIVNASDNTLHIIDLKTGRGRVKAERNYQLMLYAYGVAYKLINEYSLVDRIVLHVVQNNVRAGNNTNLWVTSFDEIETFIKSEVEPAIKSYKEDAEPFHKVSYEVCQWCKVKPYCKHFIYDSLQGVKDIKDFEVVEEKGDDPYKINSQDLKIAELLKIYKLVNSSIEVLEDHLKSKIEYGSVLDGFSLKNGRKITTWRDDIKQDDLIKKLGRWVEGGKNNTFNLKVKTPKQIRELFKDDEPSTRLLNSFNSLVKIKELDKKLNY